MTRLFIAVIALSTLVVLPTMAPRQGSTTSELVAQAADTGIVTRRLFEGPDLQDSWLQSVSPDGRYLSQSNGPGGTVVAYDLLYATRRPITKPDDGFYEEVTKFSPDGHTIAYTGFAGSTGEYEIRVIDVDGSNQRVIWRAGDDPSAATLKPYDWPSIFGWTPDGKALIVGLWATRNLSEMLLMPVDGSPTRLLYQPPLGKEPGAAAVSPDGRYLAFSMNTEVRSPETPEPRSGVFLLPLAEEGRPIAVASGPGSDELVGWTPDGRILLVSDRELTEGLWSVTIREGRPVGEPTLVKGDLWGMSPIGVAGDAVYYGITTQVPQVHTVDISLDGRRLVGSLRPVEAEMRPSTFPAWSPDGRRLAYRAADRQAPLLVIRSTSGDAAQEVGGFQRIVGINWSSDGGEIHFHGELAGDDRKRSWLVFDMSAGTTRVVRHPGEGPDCGIPLLHPAGRRQFCLHEDQERASRQIIEVDLESLDWKVVWEVKEGTSLGSPSLSPDGSRIALWEYKGPDGVLHVIPVDGGDPADVLKTTRKAGEASCFGRRLPLWTPDGDHLLIETSRVLREGERPGADACQVQLASLAGGEPVAIGTLPEHGDWALSPDGTRLAVVAGEDRGEIWVLEGAGR